MALITEKGLGNAVLAAVQLDNSHTAGHIASANRPENSILADLAVVIRKYFACSINFLASCYRWMI